MFISCNLYAQQDSIRQHKDLYMKVNSQTSSNTIDILGPAKAAFYSTVFPGLGQIYNKQYWKLPLVYGAIGAGFYFYNFNLVEYKRFRMAYFNRKNGLPDEFSVYGTDVLISAQKYYRHQRDTALLLTILAYALNIVDANVSAHLKQWNVDDNLSFRPVQIFTQEGEKAIGINLQINLFK